MHADRGGFAFTGNSHLFDPEFAEIVVDGVLAVVSVRGHRAGRAPGTRGDPPDRRGQLRRIGWVADGASN